MADGTELYIYSQSSYDGSIRSKVGVSKNHRNRNFSHYGTGGFSFYKAFPMPSRSAAFHLESLVCKSFPAFIFRELLDAPPEQVCQFIEQQLDTFKASR